MTNADRNAILRALRWARSRDEHGRRRWTPGPEGWQDADDQVRVDWETHRRVPVVRVSRRDTATGGWQHHDDELPVRSPVQAVDVLCALGVLPVELSSGYDAGVQAGRTSPTVTVTVEHGVTVSGTGTYRETREIGAPDLTALAACPRRWGDWCCGVRGACPICGWGRAAHPTEAERPRTEAEWQAAQPVECPRAHTPATPPGEVPHG